MPKTMHTIDVYPWDTQTDIVSNSIPAGTPGRNGAFIPLSEEVSTYPVSFVLEGRPKVLWNSVGLFDIAADSVTVEIVNGPAYSATKNLAYSDPLSDDYPNVTRVVFTDLPDVDPVVYPTAVVKVSLTAPGRTAHLGFLVTGPRTDLFACVFYGTTLGIQDYSRKERDTFGNITLTERGYSNWINYLLGYDETLLSQIRNYLASRRVALTVYIGAEDDPKTLVLGYFEDFQIGLEPGPVSEGYLLVDSVVYDKPQSWSEYRVAFGEYSAVACDYGDDYLFIQVIAGIPTAIAQATIEGRAIAAGESVSWHVALLDGETGISYSTGLVTTPCGDLSVWQWPATPPGADQGVWKIKLSAKLTLDDGTVLDIQPAILQVSSDSGEGICTACLPEIVAPIWVTNNQQSESGLVAPAAAMVEIPAYTQVSINNAGSGHRYFWVDLPDNLSTCRIQTVFATGTATPVYAKLWNPCDGKLPDASSEYTGDDFLISVSYADRSKWTAVLVRIDDGTYTGTIERLITLQLPT